MPARSFAIAALACAITGTAALADPVKDNLDAARAKYQSTIDKLNNGVLDALKKREDDARRAGQSKLLDTTKTERNVFE
jgi:hypothetical protein